MTLDEFDGFLSRTLNGDCRLLCSKQDPPKRGDIASLGPALGVQLPPDYLAFQGKYGAAYFEVKESVWPRPKMFQAGPYWSFLYACMVLGIGRGVPELLDIHANTKSLAESYGQSAPFRLIPLFRWVGAADYVCCDEGGNLFWLSHEIPGEPKAIEMPFLEYLAQEITTLVSNKSRIRTEAAFLFETEEQRMEKRRQVAERDAAITNERCPKCGSPCPSYRKTCKVCGDVLRSK